MEGFIADFSLYLVIVKFSSAVVWYKVWLGDTHLLGCPYNPCSLLSIGAYNPITGAANQPQQEVRPPPPKVSGRDANRY